jgi:hypothetical protein
MSRLSRGLVDTALERHNVVYRPCPPKRLSKLWTADGGGGRVIESQHVGAPSYNQGSKGAGPWTVRCASRLSGRSCGGNIPWWDHRHIKFGCPRNSARRKFPPPNSKQIALLTQRGRQLADVRDIRGEATHTAETVVVVWRIKAWIPRYLATASTEMNHPSEFEIFRALKNDR